MITAIQTIGTYYKRQTSRRKALLVNCLVSRTRSRDILAWQRHLSDVAQITLIGYASMASEISHRAGAPSRRPWRDITDYTGVLGVALRMLPAAIPLTELIHGGSSCGLCGCSRTECSSLTPRCKRFSAGGLHSHIGLPRIHPEINNRKGCHGGMRELHSLLYFSFTVTSSGYSRKRSFILKQGAAQ